MRRFVGVLMMSEAATESRKRGPGDPVGGSVANHAFGRVVVAMAAEKRWKDEGRRASGTGVRQPINDWLLFQQPGDKCEAYSQGTDNEQGKRDPIRGMRVPVSKFLTDQHPKARA
jgi:hypothetical protein